MDCLACKLSRSYPCRNNHSGECVYLTGGDKRQTYLLAIEDEGGFSVFALSHEGAEGLWHIRKRIDDLGKSGCLFGWSELVDHFVVMDKTGF